MGKAKMAKGKNKKLGRKGRNKKGEKHAFLKKEWHKLISPTDLKGTKMIGWTCVNKTQGTKISTDYLKGRVGEITVTDIRNNGVRNADNYIFRIFLTSVSQRGKGQLRINSYCKSSTIRLLRKKTVQWLQNTVKAMTAEKLANSVVDQELQKNLRSVMKKVYPNLHTIVRKVKLIRKGATDRRNFLKQAISKTTANQAEVEENPEAKNALSE